MGCVLLPFSVVSVLKSSLNKRLYYCLLIVYNMNTVYKCVPLVSFVAKSRFSLNITIMFIY